jgi:coproporphyrinogen III oxidase-like Fe-S oxidoreductase
MTSVDELSDAGKLAYQAFVDMSNSKAAHFRCLEAIDATYQAGGAPSLVEKRDLEKLLASHDRNVLAFKTAMAAITSDAEKQALIELMS